MNFKVTLQWINCKNSHQQWFLTSLHLHSHLFVTWQMKLLFWTIHISIKSSSQLKCATQNLYSFINWAGKKNTTCQEHILMLCRGRNNKTWLLKTILDSVNLVMVYFYTWWQMSFRMKGTWNMERSMNNNSSCSLACTYQGRAVTKRKTFQ